MTVDVNAIQAAIYTILTGASVADGGVFDSYNLAGKPVIGEPIVNIGDYVAANDDTNTEEGERIDWTLYIYSRYDGTKEISQVAKAIRAALHKQDITVAGLSSCITFVDGHTSSVDADGQTRRGIVRVRCHARE
jgi:hypothetical protein